MAKGTAGKPALETMQRMRAEMFTAIDRIWKLAPGELQSVKVQAKFTSGETIGQGRKLSD